MSYNLQRAQSLQCKIKDILLKEWDPIGVQDIPEAQDEYDAYVASIYKLLISKRDLRLLMVGRSRAYGSNWRSATD